MTEEIDPQSMGTHTMIAISFNDHSADNYEFARGNMDGTWWFDWPTIEKQSGVEPSEDPSRMAYIMLAQLFLAAKGRLPEVSLERAEEISREAAARENERIKP